MPFAENELVFMEDAYGKKHWLKVAYKMLKINSLGTVDGERFKELDDGSRMTVAGKEFTVFRPTTADMMTSLERGAQIITPKDAEVILFRCDIRAGSTVIEVGAGSGALTIALLRAVSPNGRVLTLELREDNAQLAGRNVRRMGFDNWECTVCDAREADPDITADALVMDMPDPENAFGNLLPKVRPGGMVCVYVPNANQLQNAVNAMRDAGLRDVSASETMQREMVVHPGGVRPSFDMLGHTGYLAFGRRTA
ncbi:MAG: methyltransferase domain-containing protein [Candidatus Methanomethylophilaceae archaeon]|jgi:tRNA (adenine57-N1/adenine58-N1)-methyltransferase|nr:methyltransferase domain-containing protein [Candidatus Methanomethylophilaceae archaeon]